jgi:hypothetical protein
MNQPNTELSGMQALVNGLQNKDEKQSNLKK